MRLTAALICAALLGTAARAEDTRYTLEDLKALGEQQSWGELVQHAEDVRPTERKQVWKELLEKASSGLVGQLVDQKKDAEAVATAEQLTARFPVLKTSKAFMARRGAAVVAAAATCFEQLQNGWPCVDELDRLTKVDPSDAELAFKAGKVIVERGRLYAAAPPFFARGLAPPAARAAGCKDPAVIDAVLRAFGQPPHYDNAKAAGEVAFKQCFAELKPKLLAAFLSSDGYDSVNLCLGLLDQKAKLTEFQSAFCQDQVAK